jgi:sortase B
MSRKDKRKNKKKLLIINVIQLILIIILVYSVMHIVIWYKNNKTNKKIIEEISKAVEINENTEDKQEYKVNFEELKNKNSDTVAWIKVENTNIEFPVVKANDNNYYLTHNFNKENNKAGWIFADYKNKFNGTDKNIVIYGHNMRDKSMFGSLKDVIKEEWYNNEENKYITFVTENEYQTYQVFSVYQIEKENYYIQTDFKNNEFEEFIKTIKQRSKKEFNVDVTSKDNILTLSTCANNNKYRVVLHAKKTDNLY